nr:hypothetical protein GCM10010200_064440 [Actinomadura rugatobispora]
MIWIKGAKQSDNKDVRVIAPPLDHLTLRNDRTAQSVTDVTPATGPAQGRDRAPVAQSDNG